MGASFRSISESDCPLCPKPAGGLRIIQVISGSAAERAGLQAGDIIVRFDGRRLQKEAGANNADPFIQYLRNEKKAGDTILLDILRLDTSITMKSGESISRIPTLDQLVDLLSIHPYAENLSVAIEKHLQPQQISVVLGAFSEKPPTAMEKIQARFSSYQATPNPISDLLQELIDKHDLAQQYQNFQAALIKDELDDDRFKLELIEYIRHNPMRLNSVGLQLSAEIGEMAKDRSIRSLLEKSVDLLDLPLDQICKTTGPKFPSAPASTDFSAHIQYIQAVVAAALAERDQAFQYLSKADQQFLTRHIHQLARSISQSCGQGQIEDTHMPADELKCLAMAHQIDYPKLFESACILLSLMDPTWLEQFKKSSASVVAPLISPALPGVTGQILHSSESNAGLILIGGPGPNRYTRDDIAVLIDLGGDDFYGGPSGCGDIDHPIGILMDLEGNDRYAASADFAQGTGILGIGIITDLDGNDQYTGLGLAQAAGLMGIGILMDLSGNDAYQGQELNQGFGYWGLGLLLDSSGNDCYESHFHSQGVGGPKGVGLLLDSAGDDRYYAGGKYPSCYQNPGIFQGLSQGFGFGLRGDTGGGIGMLIDTDGADHFEAGDFSQGCGFAYGLGLLKNSGDNNDFYLGSRYAQGCAAHSAAGILIDEGGDDVYSGLVGALQAAAWDKSIAVLNDQAGNDVYSAQELFFSQGAAAHNGFALFLDTSGNNRYLPPTDAKIGSNAYHGGNSFSFFIRGTDGLDRSGRPGIISSESLSGEYGFVVEISGN